MIALTKQDILLHQQTVQWPELYQVEQDLLLSHAMVAIFEDEFLAAQVAMRGGTVLHKVHLAPAVRYSEDIDLVVVGDRPKEHIQRALNRVLRPLLGKEKSSIWTQIKLAVRNAAKPSEILRCIYKVHSVAEPRRVLTIEIEANVTERTPKFPLQILPFSFSYRGVPKSTQIVSYNIDEMLGTKMRALFQRKKGRDLFDLYWALTAQTAMPVSPVTVVAAFAHYMAEEDSHIPRAEFSAHLASCLADKAGFCQDMLPLLKVAVAYKPEQAAQIVQANLIDRLP